MKHGIAFALTCAGSLLLAESGMAADVYSPVTPEAKQVVTEQGWTFTVAPYFWAAGISGDVGLFGLPPVEVDASFSDIFDHLAPWRMFVTSMPKRPTWSGRWCAQAKDRPASLARWRFV
ncbi:hypothetical protein DEV91_1531 [Phyllobacterium brassicacearum]|nr:hypothetical protein DEV91_1531 [Phyllobacterium brassicacearum]